MTKATDGGENAPNVTDEVPSRYMDEDVAVSIGRELLAALTDVPGVGLDFSKNTSLIEEREGFRLTLTSNDRLPAKALSALSDRGYDLSFRGCTSDGDAGDPQHTVVIPPAVIESFAKYVDARGEPHPAPPSDRGFIPTPGFGPAYTPTSITQWEDMEDLPHPEIDAEAFRNKVEEVTTDS